MTTQTNLTLVSSSEPEEGLILDGENEIALKEEQKVLGILNNFQDSKMSAKKKDKLNNIANLFAHMFVRKSWDVLGASGEQLKQLTSAQLKIADKILAQKSRKSVVWQYGLVGLLALIPIFGWMAILGVFNVNAYEPCSINLYRLRKKLQKAYGDDYFPEERIRFLIGHG